MNNPRVSEFKRIKISGTMEPFVFSAIDRAYWISLKLEKEKGKGNRAVQKALQVPL